MCSNSYINSTSNSNNSMNISYDFIGKIETLSKDAESLHKLFPAEFQNIFTVLHSKKNSKRKRHDTISQNYFSQLPRLLIEQLYQSYQTDFDIGGYPFPKDYITLGKSWTVINFYQGMLCISTSEHVQTVVKIVSISVLTSFSITNGKRN